MRILCITTRAGESGLEHPTPTPSAPLSTAAVFSAWQRRQHKWRRYPLSHPDPSTTESLLLRGGVHPNPGPQSSHPPAFPCSVCSCRVTEGGVSFLCTSCHHWVHRRCSRLASVAAYTPPWSCPSCSGLTQASAPRKTRDLSPPRSPPHHPQHHLSPSPPDSFPLLQYNCNGLQHSSSELTHFMATHSVLIAAIQEIKLARLETSSFSLLFLRPSQQTAGQAGWWWRPSFSHSPLHFLLLTPHRSSLPRFPHPPTFQRKSFLPRSSPALETSWTPLTCLNSDHLPIAISLPTNQPPPPAELSPISTQQTGKPSPFALKRSSVMLHYPPLAHKGKLSSVTPSKLLPIASSPGAAGKISSRIFPSTIPLINQRNVLRSTNPNDPSLSDLNNITSAISTHSRQTWIDRVQSHSLQQNPSQFRSLLKFLSGKSNNQLSNQGITFGNRFTTSNPIIAQSFCHQFTIVPHFRCHKSSRKIFRSIHKLHPLDRSFHPFTVDQTKEAIKKSGTSTGLSTSPYSTSATSAPRAYPISPTSSTSLPRLYPFHLENSYHHHHPLTWQATLSQLFLPPYITPLSCRQSAGTTVLPSAQLSTAIDFSKAFDTVPHPQLISQISSLPLNHHVVRWLVCYLKGRSAKRSYHHHLSSSRPVLAGVLQGSVISPALFNLFVSDYPPTAPLIASYADDFTELATTTKIPDASAILSAHSSDVAT
ncbi:Reverse transcriptase domain [Trinorchestia longiramus]|nr:Reverse transcriptase domain [Trinorchestia longiramus]